MDEKELELELYSDAKEKLQEAVTNLCRNPKTYGEHIDTVHYLMGMKRTVKETLEEDLGLMKFIDNAIAKLINGAKEEMDRERERFNDLQKKVKE